MPCQAGKKVDETLFRHPLIQQLGTLATEASGLALMVVYPTAEGWQQTPSDERTELKPAFCRLIQSTSEGAKHCRMCHIMMSVAACRGGPREQRCHAGASVLVCPSTCTSGQCIAVVSSCLFSHRESWDSVRARGAKLGLDPAALRQAFHALPKLAPSQASLLRATMQAMGLAVGLLMQNSRLAAQAQGENGGRRGVLDLSAVIRKIGAGRRPRSAAPAAAASAPLLVRVVCDLVQQRPGLPLTVKELAAAANVTPNHLSTLFHQHMGVPFTDYLTQQRIAFAKKLLGDLTLNINEVARQAGYDDPGYFARRFRQQTKLSPRVWRNRNFHAASPA